MGRGRGIGVTPAAASCTPRVRQNTRGADVEQGQTSQHATAQRRRGRPPLWTPQRLEAELRAFLGERPDWPTAGEFIDAGRLDLWQALKKQGGIQPWASLLGKSLRPGQDRSAYTLQDALADAQRLIAEQGQLPGINRVRELGYPRLATHLARRERREALHEALDAST